MLKFQIALATLLICSIAFVSCGRVQDLLEPPADDTPTEMVMEMMAAHKSWDHVMLPAPTMTIPEAAAAMNPGGTGQAHGVGTRTVYFNEVGAMANRAGAAYPRRDHDCQGSYGSYQHVYQGNRNDDESGHRRPDVCGVCGV